MNMLSGQWPKHFHITLSLHCCWDEMTLSLVCFLTDPSVISGNLLHLAVFFLSSESSENDTYLVGHNVYNHFKISKRK